MIGMTEACEALGFTPGELADLLRHETARQMRLAATALDDGYSSDADDALHRVIKLLNRIDALELVWEISHPDSNDDAASSGTEATPHHSDTDVVAAPEDSR